LKKKQTNKEASAACCQGLEEGIGSMTMKQKKMTKNL